MSQEVEEAPMNVVVNGVEQGIITVLARGGDVWVPLSALAAAGLQNLAGRRESRQDVQFVSLTSLAPSVRFEVDENTVTLRITSAPELLSTTVKDLRSQPDPVSYRRQNNLFLNYSLHVQNGGAFSGNFDAGANVRSALAATDFSISNGKVVRGFTSISHDDPQNLRRWVIGDSLTGATALMASVRQFGLTVTRNFSLNPYFFPGPAFELTTNIQTPSTVEIYVNGTLASRQEVGPGPLLLKNLPVTQGAGSIRVVIRDSLGHEEQITQPFYFATGLLAPGISEFTYNAGVIGSGVLGQRSTYGEPIVSANQRLGLTKSLTGGYFFQRSSSSACGGATATVRLFAGQLDVEIGESRTHGQSGEAGSAGYVLFGSHGTIGSTVRIRSARWTTPGTMSEERPPREVALFASVPLMKRLSTSAQFSESSSPQGGPSRRIAIQASKGGHRISGYASLERTRDKSGAHFAFRIGMIHNLGGLRSASVSIDKTSTATSSIVQVSRSLSSGPGYGYRLDVRPGSYPAVSAEVQYQNALGRIEAGGAKTASGATAFADISGSVLSMGGVTYLSRSLGDAFALMRVPGVAGVPAYVGNQEVGRTNRRGDLVVPNLVPYYRNEIRLGTAGMPFNYTFTTTSQTLAPAFRSGAVVEFPISRLHAVTGRVRIRDADREIVPAFGALTLTAGASRLESPIGSGGDFYFEKLPAGDYPAELEHAGRVCSFRLRVPPSHEDFNDAGDWTVDAARDCKAR